MNITNGTVEIERQVRPADYESKKVKVALSFAIDEAEKAEHVIEHVASLAHDHVMAALKRVETAVLGKKEPTAAADPTPTPTPISSSPAPTASLGSVAAAVSAPANATAPATPNVAPAAGSIVTDAQVLETIQGVLNRAGADKEAVNRKIVDIIGEVAGAVGASYRTIPADDPRRSQLIAKLNALVPMATAQAGVPNY